jgi:hypothetical protein
MRPDQQQGDVVKTLRRAIDDRQTMYGDTTKAMAYNDLTRDSLNALDAVAEYIAANDELRGWIDRALLPSYDEKRKPIPESLRKGLERLDAAHARMKGVAK